MLFWYAGRSWWACGNYRFPTKGYNLLTVKSFGHYKYETVFDYLYIGLVWKQQRVQKNLAILNKRVKGGCSCLCLLFSVIGIVVLVVALWSIIKYLWCAPMFCMSIGFVLLIRVLCFCNDLCIVQQPSSAYICWFLDESTVLKLLCDTQKQKSSW